MSTLPGRCAWTRDGHRAQTLLPGMVEISNIDDVIDDEFCSVEFSVGAQPVNKFRMIERHFFRDQLLKTFDFNFG